MIIIAIIDIILNINIIDIIINNIMINIIIIFFKMNIHTILSSWYEFLLLSMLWNVLNFFSPLLI